MLSEAGKQYVHQSSVTTSSETTATTDSAELLRVAERAARRAGDIQRKHLGDKSPTVLENKSRDMKILVDRLCEKAVCKCILEAYPDHAILSEECGLRAAASRYVWIIDPLDGTLNYFFGLPLFCVCVACYYLPVNLQPDQLKIDHNQMAQAEQLAGVVYAPLLHRMYSAAAGQGATFNGCTIFSPEDTYLEDAMVGISYGSDDDVIQNMEAVNSVLVRTVKKVRIFGSTGLDLTHVAKGHLSALVQLKVRIWDIAAPLVILKEANVHYDVRPGQFGGWQIIAAVPSLFQQLKNLVNMALDKPRC
jgi:fructose-1,6-bisphosphatase/inositol monophosphatase family enzyme